MISSNMPRAILCLSLAALIFTSCQKEMSGEALTENDNNNHRNSGFILPDISFIKKSPLIVSQDYLDKQVSAPSIVPSGVAKGRPTKGSTTTDKTLPAVSFNNPINGSQVSDNVEVQISATDNVGVVSVIFQVNGTEQAVMNNAPYNINWNTSSLSDGIHYLTATALDAAGNSATASISVSKKTTITIVNPPPASFPASYSLKMPPIGNQGTEFSCIAFAASYVRSSERYYKTNATSYSYNTNIFSPEYIYNQVKFGECYSGTTIERCLNLLQSQGVCTWQSLPYNSTNGCSIMPTSGQISEAANYKIGSYAMLYPNDISAIKEMLTKNHALITGSPIDNAFQNAGPGFIWSSFNGNYGNNHGYVICGYDDSKKAFKIMNSWGTGWGDNGYSWIDYDFFGKIGAGVFVMQNAY